jgi:amino acid transporter
VFSEAEFWLALGKVLLFLICFFFTIVTMAGGNPQHDAYGFRYWNNPGAFAESVTTGDLGRFHGFMGALSSALFTVVGPEYLSMVAGEAQRPRTYLKSGFKSVYWRFGLFFIGASLIVGIVLPYTEPRLDNAGSGTADGSPFVIAMQLMGVGVLPHIVNALLCTSIFSAGNAYTYCAMRCLYGLALQGQAPPIFRKCLRNGVPIWCFVAVMIFPCISFLQVSGTTAQVVSLLQSLTSASGLINYIVISVTYIFFYRACKAQGLDRKTLPYRGYFQPYGAYIGAAWMSIMVFFFGYSSFLEGNWDTLTFFSYYTMAFVAIITFTGWKLLKRTRFVRPSEADLVWDRPIIDAYEANLGPRPNKSHKGFANVFRSSEKSESSV